MSQPQYAVSVWLSKHKNEEALQQYIEPDYNDDGDAISGFGKESGLGNIDTDFVEALCYHRPLDLFDSIDHVSYAKYFRSECVKMLYPQQFNDYSAIIFVYGKNPCMELSTARYWNRRGLPRPMKICALSVLSILKYR